MAESAPRLVLVHGSRGAGKTTFINALLGAPLLPPLPHAPGVVALQHTKGMDSVKVHLVERTTHRCSLTLGDACKPAERNEGTAGTATSRCRRDPITLRNALQSVLGTASVNSTTAVSEEKTMKKETATNEGTITRAAVLECDLTLLQADGNAELLSALPVSLSNGTIIAECQCASSSGERDGQPTQDCPAAALFSGFVCGGRVLAVDVVVDESEVGCCSTSHSRVAVLNHSSATRAARVAGTGSRVHQLQQPPPQHTSSISGRTRNVLYADLLKALADAVVGGGLLSPAEHTTTSMATLRALAATDTPDQDSPKRPNNGNVEHTPKSSSHCTDYVGTELVSGAGKQASGSGQCCASDIVEAYVRQHSYIPGVFRQTWAPRQEEAEEVVSPWRLNSPWKPRDDDAEAAAILKAREEEAMAVIKARSYEEEFDRSAARSRTPEGSKESAEGTTDNSGRSTSKPDPDIVARHVDREQYVPRHVGSTYIPKNVPA